MEKNINTVDRQYLSLLNEILEHGVEKDTRSGKVLSLFGKTMRFNLKEGFPLLTTKKVFYRGIIEELLWFLKGVSNIAYLKEKNVHIWDKDAYRYYTELCDKYKYEYNLDDCFNDNIKELRTQKIVPISFDEFIAKIDGNNCMLFGNRDIYNYGDLGNMYPTIWRHFGSNDIDQIKYVINELKTNPFSRRIVLTCYDPNSVNEAALYPCHILYEFNVTIDEKGQKCLNCVLNCRSTDVPLGLPFNIASAAFLVHMLAQVVGMNVGELLYVGCDCHIYCNQIDAVMEQLARDPDKYALPTLKLNANIKDIDDFTYDDFEIQNYNSYPSIKAPLSVG